MCSLGSAQKIDKELKTALDALEKEKATALKDLDSQVLPLCLPQLFIVPCEFCRADCCQPSCAGSRPLELCLVRCMHTWMYM